MLSQDRSIPIPSIASPNGEITAQQLPPLTREFRAAYARAGDVLEMGFEMVLAMNAFAQVAALFRVSYCDDLHFGVIAAKLRSHGEKIERRETGRIRSDSAATIRAGITIKSRQLLDRMTAAVAAISSAEEGGFVPLFFVPQGQPIIHPESRERIVGMGVGWEMQRAHVRGQVAAVAEPTFAAPLRTAITNAMELDSKYPLDGTREPHVRACFHELMIRMKEGMTELQRMPLWDGSPRAIELLTAVCKLHTNEINFGALLFNELLDPVGIDKSQQQSAIAKHIFRNGAELRVSSGSPVVTPAYLHEELSRDVLSFIEAAGRLTDARDRIAGLDESAALADWLAFRGEHQRLSDVLSKYPSQRCADRAGQLVRDGIITADQGKIIVAEVGLLPLPPLCEPAIVPLVSPELKVERVSAPDDRSLVLEILEQQGISNPEVIAAVKSGTLTVERYDHRRAQLAAALLGNFTAADLVLSAAPMHFISSASQFDGYLKRIGPLSIAIVEGSESSSATELERVASSLATDQGVCELHRLHLELAKILGGVPAAEAILTANPRIISLGEQEFQAFHSALSETLGVIRVHGVSQLPEYQPRVTPENFSSIEALAAVGNRIKVEGELPRDGFSADMTLTILRALRQAGIARSVLNLPAFAQVWGQRQVEGEIKLLIARGAISLGSGGLSLVPSRRVEAGAVRSMVKALQLVEQEQAQVSNDTFSLPLDFLFEERTARRPAKVSAAPRRFSR